ncbi:sugar O-acetyltransferase [Niabella soli]|uniref:Acetyltransferase n=1 Tax=Niabella soli DSM 19437 TaxID=929713 RepID=W0EWN2_9BACT|nr:sugar O-acetyltransferase [Niabella soli]AHF15205.1 maltose O-acetyltransferase [Niabella soli DSM 19437]
MTEKEKCKQGLLYAANDEQLTAERRICKSICQQYNQTEYSNIEKRNELLEKIIKKTKQHFVIEQPFWCDYGYNIELGENFYSNHNLIILDGAKVTFGDNVFIGPNCGFYTAGHPVNIEQRNEGLEYAQPITIGNNVWLGGNAVVMPGVTIGDNTIIGAGSVVTKPIPGNVVAVGNPCRILKELK